MKTGYRGIRSGGGTPRKSFVHNNQRDTVQRAGEYRPELRGIGHDGMKIDAASAHYMHETVKDIAGMVPENSDYQDVAKSMIRRSVRARDRHTSGRMSFYAMMNTMQRAVDFGDRCYFQHVARAEALNKARIASLAALALA